MNKKKTVNLFLKDNLNKKVETYKLRKKFKRYIKMDRMDILKYFKMDSLMIIKLRNINFVNVKELF